MDLDDRFTRGFIAGLIGGLASLAWGVLSKNILEFTKLLYTDFASILIYGEQATTFIEKIFAQIVVFGFWGLDGIIFIYLILYIGSKNLVFKGLSWGAFIWFFSYVVTLLYKVPGIEIIDVNTSISQLIGGLIWGWVLALAIKYLDRRFHTM